MSAKNQPWSLSAQTMPSVVIFLDTLYVNADQDILEMLRIHVQVSNGIWFNIWCEKKYSSTYKLRIAGDKTRNHLCLCMFLLYHPCHAIKRGRNLTVDSRKESKSRSKDNSLLFTSSWPFLVPSYSCWWYLNLSRKLSCRFYISLTHTFFLLCFSSSSTCCFPFSLVLSCLVCYEFIPFFFSRKFITFNDFFYHKKSLFFSCSPPFLFSGLEWSVNLTHLVVVHLCFPMKFLFKRHAFHLFFSVVLFFPKKYEWVHTSSALKD